MPKPVPLVPSPIAVSPSKNGAPEVAKAVPKKAGNLPVVYPEVKASLRYGPSALTFIQACELIGWEDEETYKKRMTTDPKKKAVVGYAEDYLLKDSAGRKVRCWHNTKNRPLKEPWCKALKQDLLCSGPGLTPERRRWQFNGEAIIIGRHGQVLSGQHRLIAFILAVLDWRKGDEWKRIWPTEPVLETVIVVGVDESQKTTRTLDNIQPRSLSDVFYTSSLFADITDSVQRKELSRMLEAGVKLLWKRSGAGTEVDYQTHGESSDFLDRHPRLLNCVKHMFGENRDRAISNCRLSAGECATLLYLMGTSKSDDVQYHKTRSEKGMDFANWDKAHNFFVEFLSKTEKLKPVHTALQLLVDSETATGGRKVEQHAILAKAWVQYLLRGAVKDGTQLVLRYGADRNNNMRLLKDEDHIFGGIDVGESYAKPNEEVPPPEAVEAEKKKIDAKRLEDMKEKVAIAKK